MTAKKKRPVRRRQHAKLYKTLGIPKTWIAVLDEYPNPLEVLPILMATRSISVAEEMIDSMDALADALLDAIGDEGMNETEELVRLQ
jgi:hypothetical protein